MYKLLLVSDRQEVLDAFAQVDNWELQGFKPPHIRHDFEGAKDSLSKHFCDGIAIAVARPEEEKLLAYLREYYPLVSIFEAGKTPEEVLHYLEELRVLLNRLHADFSEDEFNRLDMFMMCRHDYLRKVVTGQVDSSGDLYRNMRLLRSRMDPDRVCALVQLEQTSVRNDKLEGRWEYGPDRMELTLRHSFGGDYEGYHILPMVHPDGRILVLVGPLKGEPDLLDGEELAKMAEARVLDGIEHLSHYKGLDLHLVDVRVMPALTAFCGTQDKA